MGHERNHWIGGNPDHVTLGLWLGGGVGTPEPAWEVMLPDICLILTVL